MNGILRLLMSAVAVYVTAYVVPGVELGGFVNAIVVVVILGILNFLVRPILLVLTLPINLLTLGLFTLIINTVIILLADRLVPGFNIASFWTAFWFGIVLSFVNWFLSKVATTRSW